MMQFAPFSLRHLLASVAVVALFAVPEVLAGPPPGKGGGGGKNNASLSVTITPESITEGGPAATGTVTRENSDTSVIVTVTSSDETQALVSASDEPEATVSASVEIPVGEFSADFDVVAVDDNVKDGDQSVTISVSATDHEVASVSITVVDDGRVLPDGLNVRYRVNYIPIPASSTGFFSQDVNDAGIVAGWYRDASGGTTREVGFIYNPQTSAYINSDQMFDLGPEWEDVNFVGLNNFGAIAGRAKDTSDVYYGFVAYPVEDGWELVFLPTPPEASLTAFRGFYPRKINDHGDITGTVWKENSSDTFVINTGLYDPTDQIPVSTMGTDNLSYSHVTNYRKALFQDALGISYWFDFDAAKTLTDSDPNNDIEPISIVELPEGAWFLSSYADGPVAQDGQFVANEEVQISKKKGGTFAYAPAVLKEGSILYLGMVGDGQAKFVNSTDTEEGNTVGDIVLGNTAMLHANWGKLDLTSMLVFDSAEDAALWNSTNPDITDFSDRDAATDFGFICGNQTGSTPRLPFVLIPEVVTP